MPATHTDLTATVDRVLTVGTIDIDGVHIVGASVISLTPDNGPASAFVEIGVMAGGTALTNRVAVLASGYVGDSSPLTWTGRITGDPSQFLYMHVRADAADSYRLSLVSEVNY